MCGSLCTNIRRTLCLRRSLRYIEGIQREGGATILLPLLLSVSTQFLSNSGFDSRELLFKFAVLFSHRVEVLSQALELLIVFVA